MSGLDEKGLLPCPFCGGEGISCKINARSGVMCRECESRAYGNNRAEAIAAWNRRASAPPAPDGLEPVAWRTRGMNVLSRWMPWVMIDKVRAERWREDPSYKNGRREVEPLYSAATLSAQEAEIERLRKERDEARRLSDWYHETHNATISSIWVIIGRDTGQNLNKRLSDLVARAESAESEVARLRKVVERAKEVIAPPASLPRR